MISIFIQQRKLSLFCFWKNEKILTCKYDTIDNRLFQFLRPNPNPTERCQFQEFVHEQRYWGDRSVFKAYKNQKEIDRCYSINQCGSHSSSGFLFIQADRLSWCSVLRIITISSPLIKTNIVGLFVMIDIIVYCRCS